MAPQSPMNNTCRVARQEISPLDVNEVSAIWYNTGGGTVFDIFYAVRIRNVPNRVHARSG